MAFLAVLLARVFGINWEELHPADRARLDGKFGEFLDKMALIGIILISFWWQGKDMKVGCVVAYVSNLIYKVWAKYSGKRRVKAAAVDAEAGSKVAVAVGCTVEVSGLPEANAGANGKQAVVRSKKDDGRWSVKLLAPHEIHQGQQVGGAAAARPGGAALAPSLLHRSAAAAAKEEAEADAESIVVEESNLAVVVGVPRRIVKCIQAEERCAICWMDGGGEAPERTEKSEMPCCHKEATSIVYCRRCIEIIIEEDGNQGIGKCPTCRATIAIDSRTGAVVTRVRTGKCLLCMQGNKVLVDRGCCAACSIGLQNTFTYECDGCGGRQRIPHPMWRYQPTAEAFGVGETWACHQGCGAQTHWRIVDPSAVLDQDAPEGWGRHAERLERVRQQRQQERSVAAAAVAAEARAAAPRARAAATMATMARARAAAAAADTPAAAEEVEEVD